MEHEKFSLKQSDLDWLAQYLFDGLMQRGPQIEYIEVQLMLVGMNAYLDLLGQYHMSLWQRIPAMSRVKLEFQTADWPRVLEKGIYRFHIEAKQPSSITAFGSSYIDVNLIERKALCMPLSSEVEITLYLWGNKLEFLDPTRLIPKEQP